MFCFIKVRLILKFEWIGEVVWAYAREWKSRGEKRDQGHFQIFMNIKTIPVYINVRFQQSNLCIPLFSCQSNDCCGCIFNSKEWLVLIFHAKIPKLWLIVIIYFWILTFTIPCACWFLGLFSISRMFSTFVRSMTLFPDNLRNVIGFLKMHLSLKETPLAIQNVSK